jgi:starch synthase
VALLPWGNAIEDFLDTLGLTLEDFRDEMSGGWMFGYVEALRSAGLETVLVCVSRAHRRVRRWHHRATGAEMLVVPRPRAYDALARALRDPYAHDHVAAAAREDRAGLLAARVAYQAAPYAATPLRVLARELRGCAAVLCQEYEYARFDASVVLGRMLRTPVFATFQGGDRTRPGVEQRVRPRTMAAAAGFAIASAAEAARVRETYGVTNVAGIPNPIDLSGWTREGRARERSALGIAGRDVVIAWHGRVDIHRKGLDVLLHAWRLLAERDGLRLLLVGSGADGAELRKRLGDLDRVTWIDEYLVDRGRIAALLSAGDIYAFPSRHEGFPVAPLEAMALGLPVVAADAPGVAEIIPSGEGVVVPREDGAALAEAIATLADDPARREELGRRGRAHVEAAFSVPAVGGALRELLLGAQASDQR